MADSGPLRRRSRRNLDALADGVPDESALGRFVSDMRALGDNEGEQPNRALAEFVAAPDRAASPAVAAAGAEKARTPVITQLSTLAATTLGKVALAGGVAAAAAGGVVVVNEIQDPEPREIVITADHTSSATATTETGPGAASPTSTTTAGPTSTTDSPSTGPTTSAGPTSTTGLDTAIEDTAPTGIDADGAGSVRYQVLDGQLVLLEAVAADGWTIRNESNTLEIDLSFRTTDGLQRVDVDIEIEDGRPRVRVERKLPDPEDETRDVEDPDDIDDPDDDDPDADGPDADEPDHESVDDPDDD